jgi:uncharacterized membrane protein YkoI
VEQEVLMRRFPVSRRLALAGVLLVAVLTAGVAIAATTGDDDQPLSGSTRERAVDAALAHVGGGTVLETEAGDDDAAYGVEVRRADGSVVEVELDEGFKVIGQEADDDKVGENEDGDD